MTDSSQAVESQDAAVASAEQAQSKPVIIRTLGVKKIYGEGESATHALRGVDSTLFRGEFIAVMGPSGSGKSTYFNMIGALDHPSEGRILIDEVDVAQLSAVELAFLRCQKIGYIFQSYNLIRYMTALENVTVPMAFAGVAPEEARRRGMGLLELVGLDDRWDHRPIEMSGGHRTLDVQPAQDPPGRRTHRQPRPQDRPVDPRHPAADQQGTRSDRRLLHPRSPAAQHLRPDHVDP